MLWNPVIREEYPIFWEVSEDMRGKLVSFEGKLALPKSNVLCEELCKGVVKFHWDKCSETAVAKEYIAPCTVTNKISHPPGMRLREEVFTPLRTSGTRPLESVTLVAELSDDVGTPFIMDEQPSDGIPSFCSVEQSAEFKQKWMNPFAAQGNRLVPGGWAVLRRTGVHELCRQIRSSVKLTTSVLPTARSADLRLEDAISGRGSLVSAPFVSQRQADPCQWGNRGRSLMSQHVNRREVFLLSLLSGDSDGKNQSRNWHQGRGNDPRSHHGGSPHGGERSLLRSDYRGDSSDVQHDEDRCALGVSVSRTVSRVSRRSYGSDIVLSSDSSASFELGSGNADHLSGDLSQASEVSLVYFTSVKEPVADPLQLLSPWSKVLGTKSRKPGVAPLGVARTLDEEHPVLFLECQLALTESASHGRPWWGTQSGFRSFFIKARSVPRMGKCYGCGCFSETFWLYGSFMETDERGFEVCSYVRFEVPLRSSFYPPKVLAWRKEIRECVEKPLSKGGFQSLSG
jgi:hypothetical protein